MLAVFVEDREREKVLLDVLQIFYHFTLYVEDRKIFWFFDMCLCSLFTINTLICQLSKTCSLHKLCSNCKFCLHFYCISYCSTGHKINNITLVELSMDLAEKISSRLTQKFFLSSVTEDGFKYPEKRFQQLVFEIVGRINWYSVI